MALKCLPNLVFLLNFAPLLRKKIITAISLPTITKT